MLIISRQGCSFVADVDDAYTGADCRWNTNHATTIPTTITTPDDTPAIRTTLTASEPFLGEPEGEIEGEIEIVGAIEGETEGGPVVGEYDGLVGRVVEGELQFITIE